MEFYKDNYDAIVVGASLSGMSCALELAKKDKSVLVLEKHNLPGGLATSFVKNGQEYEATLHEMMSIGEETKPLKIRTFLESNGIHCDWLRVPEAYKLFVPKENIDIVLHAGWTGSIENNKYKSGKFVMADELNEAYPGCKDEVNRLMNLCAKVYNSVNVLSVSKESKPMMLLKHPEFVKTCGYSTREVLDTFKLALPVRDILKAYWIYVGTPFSDLPFTIYAVLMADYFIGGPYICKEFSHELSVRMAEKLLELGVDIEYNQEVTGIIVNNGCVTGVKTKRGDIINSKCVATSTYPNKTYGSLIEPISEVPSEAFRFTNSRKIGLSCFSVLLRLDKKPSDLNIHNYSVFSSTSEMDLDTFFEEANTRGPYNYLSTICLNYANDSVVKEGETLLSITTLPMADPFLNIDPFDYAKIKRKIAQDMIARVSHFLGVPLQNHIIDIVIETPISVAHFTGDYLGSVYGYQHRMDDHIVARLEHNKETHFIKGLAFIGAHGVSGNGMSPCITNGRKAAYDLMEDMGRKR